MTGDLADALDRDLRTDQLDLDDLGWRGLWAYVTTAPPGTAIYYARTEGWSVSDKLDAEQLHTLRVLLRQYNAVHFEGGADAPFPEQIPYPGYEPPERVQVANSWAAATLDDIVSPQVRALLKGA